MSEKDLCRNPDVQLKDSWSLYHWNGLSWKWVLCAPNGLKIATTDRYEPQEIRLARRWAYRLIRRMRQSK